MSGLRIILDKSVVRGLKNEEVDSLDMYFHLITPSILASEILADLAKEAEETTIENQIARHSYRISGNRVFPENYQAILIYSLLGNEVPMDGRVFPAGLRPVQSSDGSIGEKIETVLEDETIARWENKIFTSQEKDWAIKWRKQAERLINSKMYIDNIKKAGLDFDPPKNDRDLVERVDSLLQERKLQPRLFPLLWKHFGITQDGQAEIIDRWFKVGKPMFKDFAPYAFFCLRANFLWALGLTNPNLFTPDKNDGKDLEYCYYLPHCEIFSSNDKKHRRLVPFLLREDQSFIDGEELKQDLRKLFDEWNALSQEQKIQIRAERGQAPPENEDSIVFQLWNKHRKQISKPVPQGILNATIVDSSKPEEEQEELTLKEWFQQIRKELESAKEVSNTEWNRLKTDQGDSDFVIRKTKISKERLMKMYPQLKKSDFDKARE
jgi:hypothetical protein